METRSFFIKKYAIWRPSEENNTPNVEFVQPLIRRRLTQLEKIGLFLAKEIKNIGKNTKIIFASQYGEWQQTMKLIQQIHAENEMSPAGFSHSVHNAMPGLLSVSAQLKNNYTTIAANEDTIESALLEAFATKEEVLLLYAEEAIPDFYQAAFTTKIATIGIALVLSRKKSKNSQEIKVKFCKKKVPPISAEGLVGFLQEKKKISSHLFEMVNK